MTRRHPRITQRLLRGLALLGTFTAVAGLALWVRSSFAYDVLWRSSFEIRGGVQHERHLSFSSTNHYVRAVWRHHTMPALFPDAVERPQWVARTSAPTHPRDAGDAPSWCFWLGVSWTVERPTASEARSGVALMVDDTVIVTAGAIAAAGGSFARRRLARRDQRLRADLCARCGYDLRASPDRCPECGTARERKGDIPE